MCVSPFERAFSRRMDLHLTSRVHVRTALAAVLQIDGPISSRMMIPFARFLFSFIADLSSANLTMHDVSRYERKEDFRTRET